MAKITIIGDLINLEKFLNGKSYEENSTGPIYYVEEINSFVLDQSRIYVYKKAPELTGARFIEDIKLLETMSNNYIPIIDKESKQSLFSREDFIRYRAKMSGLKEYNSGDFIFSDNLYFDGLDEYISLIDKNIQNVNSKLKPVVAAFTKIINSIGLSVSLGCNSGGDVELIEAGSTSRYTNIPSSDDNKKFDFDFTVRIDADKTWIVKEALEREFNAAGHITRTSAYKVRLTDVTIDGLSHPIDLDFSLTPQKEEYLSTEQALSERLDNMRKQDLEKYKLVLANIMYAKDMLKRAGAYKPARGILDGQREYGGLGGVGIENWILQHGGSLIDATDDFLSVAENKDFIDFEKEYAIMDFGQDHVSTSKKEFPYHNFVMKNMRYMGFNIMRATLKDFREKIEISRREK